MDVQISSQNVEQFPSYNMFKKQSFMLLHLTQVGGVHRQEYLIGF